MLRPSSRLPRGFTLIELVIGISILSILIAMAAPSFSRWIMNMGIRGTAGSLLDGLQLARSEALRRNTTVRFQLTSTLGNDCALSTSGPHWIISRDLAENLCGTAPSETEAPRLIRSHDGEQAGGSRALIDAGQSLFAFNGLGRLASPAANILVSGPDGVGNCTPNGKDERCLRIEISSGGGVRMCDPALTSTNPNDPQACS
ncbi:MAG: GspH/FimT family pseudopilin [Candidatus Accumulibacter sp.]|jgi:type IV fimbrial biogenesis protein FimT|nr:GspH/FimT family pseudopilin [Accumulibacter sp.]